MAGAEPGDGLRVLSLDGPPFAAAALSEPLFLQQIAHRWIYNEDDDDGLEGEDVRASHMFDVIGGSGMGGLYAILFARLNMTIGQVIQFHYLLLDELLTTKSWVQMNHQECLEAFDRALNQMVSHSDNSVDLDSPFFSKDCMKCFIVVLNEMEGNTPMPRALRTYKVRAGSSPKCSIRQALHATIADLKHFPAVSIGGEEFVSASSSFPNVSRLLVKELAGAFPKSNLACFVNLGADRTHPANSSHMVGQDLMSQFWDLDCFFRLSLREELNAESKVMSLVMGYLQECEISRTADKIVEATKDRKRVVNVLRLDNLAGEDGRNELRRDVFHIRNEEEIKRVIENIRVPYNFPDIREHGCLEGTREDVIREIKDWTEAADGPNVFWLEGYPGTGKTAITISIKQRLANVHRLGASCFFRREEASQHSLSTLFRSIASQLANNHSSVRDNIFHAVKSGTVTIESDPSIVFEKLVCDPLIAAYVDSNSTIVLVFDGMDEFGRSEEDRMRLVKLLLPRWIQLPRRCKLFIASRSQGDLPRHLNLPCHVIKRLEVGNATSNTTIGDIRRFFEHSFQEIRSDRGNSPAFVTSPDLDELVVASAGLFIWASTIVELVRQMRKHVRQILLDLREGATTIGETEMDALHQLYSTILQPLLKDDQSIVSFLSAVIFARTPLPATALSCLCRLEVDVIEDIARQLGPVMNTASGLRFVHQSFVDYVMSRHCPVQLSIHSVELMLAESCFKIMLTQLRFNMGSIPSSYMSNSEVPELHKTLSEELRYASRFWGMHLVAVQRTRNELKVIELEILQSIKDFLHHRFLYWVEVVSILGSFGEAMEALANLKMAGLGQATSDFAQDALMFLRQFAFPISWSYAHIYVSALPWTPTGSLVRENYINTIPNVLKVMRNGDKSWLAQLAVMRGHNSWVQSVSFSPDGSRIVSGSHDTTVRIWDAATGKPATEPLQGHDKLVSSVSFSPDSSKVVSGSYDKTIRIWDVATGQSVGSPLKGYRYSVKSVAFSPDGSQIATGSDGDNTVHIWNITTCEPVCELLRGHSDAVQSVSFSLDGSYIASGSHDKTIRIWDVSTRTPVGDPFRGHTHSVISVAFSPDSSRIVSGSRDKTIRIWNVTAHHPVGEPLQGHTGFVLSVTFSPNGNLIASGSDDTSICLWDASTGESVGRPLRGHNSSVLSVAFSPDSSQIVSGSHDQTIRLWNAVPCQPVDEPFRGHSDKVNCVVFSPNGSQIASGSDDKTIRIWDVATSQFISNPLQGHNGSVQSVAFSPDGFQIVSGSDDTTVRLWDAATGKSVGNPLLGHTSYVLSVAFSPDGSQIASGSDDKTILIWDVATGQFRSPLRDHSRAVSSVVFSPDGSQIASGSYDTSVRLWDAATGRSIRDPLLGHTSYVLSVAFSPDGSRIVSGSDAAEIFIWDVPTGERVGNIVRAHSSSVLSVAFSPDGSQIVSGSDDKTLRIWDAATGRSIGNPLQGHSRAVCSVVFSPDGLQVISGSHDQTVRIWDTEAASEPKKIIQNAAFPSASYVFSP